LFLFLVLQMLHAVWDVGLFQ